MKEIAVNKFNLRMKEKLKAGKAELCAVIPVPAYFNDAQRPGVLLVTRVAVTFLAHFIV